MDEYACKVPEKVKYLYYLVCWLGIPSEHIEQRGILNLGSYFLAEPE